MLSIPTRRRVPTQRWRRRAGPDVWAVVLVAGCADTPPDDRFGHPPGDPDRAPIATIDRFSPEAATLHVRAVGNGLPEPGEPIDFDQLFLARGLGPSGQKTRYYDLDSRTQVPARLYNVVRNGIGVDGQLPIAATIPGDPGYNDFVRVYEVEVPLDYVIGAMTSEADVVASGYAVTPTDRISNIAVVPPGSNASKRWNEADPLPSRAWYGNQVIHYFTFEQDVLVAPNAFEDISVGLSYIWVTFNVNPGEPNGGPPSGAMTEADGIQTHNVLETLPGDAGYSPLWMAILYDNADFPTVVDKATASSARVVPGVPSPLVNCPVVEVLQ